MSNYVAVVCFPLDLEKLIQSICLFIQQYCTYLHDFLLTVQCLLLYHHIQRNQSTDLQETSAAVKPFLAHEVPRSLLRGKNNTLLLLNFVSFFCCIGNR